MDFVQNRISGFPLLLKRLRQRFPNAVIVYFKLLRGYVFDFPRPASRKTCITEKWYADDWHHLSARGHEILSIDLMRYFGLVGKLDLIKRQPKTLGTWNGGDQC